MGVGMIAEEICQKCKNKKIIVKDANEKEIVTGTLKEIPHPTPAAVPYKVVNDKGEETTILARYPHRLICDDEKVDVWVKGHSYPEKRDEVDQIF